MAFQSMLFADNDGEMCAISKKEYTYEQAREIACDKLVCEDVIPCHDYTHTYFGFGVSDGETDNTWWLVDNAAKNGTPVYVFRKKLD